MPFVNGVFQRVYNWVNDKNASIDITASRFDTEDDGFATGLSTAILKDGTQTLTASIPFGGFKITGYGTSAVPSARSDVPNLGQVEDGTVNWVAAAGSADAITAGYTPAITALIDGQLCAFRATAANATTLPTFSPNGLTARVITKRGGTALGAGDIPAANAEIILRYCLFFTRWELLNPCGIATKATQQAGTDAILPVTASQQQQHPSAVKAYGDVTTAGTVVVGSYPASATSAKNGVGDYTLTPGVTMSSSNYTAIFTPEPNSGATPIGCQILAKTATTVRVFLFNTTTGAGADTNVQYAVFGTLA